MNVENEPPGPPCVSPFVRKTLDLYDAIEDQDVQRVVQMIQHANGYIDSNRIVVGMEMSLLHLAVGLSNNSIEIVRAFLRCGGNPNNIVCAEKVSPLHLSVMYDFDEVMNILLIHGGDPKVLTGEGKSCFDLAMKNRVDSMDEKCFMSLCTRYCSFRQSLKRIDCSITKGISDISELTGYYTCGDSDTEEGTPTKVTSYKNSTPLDQTSFLKMNMNYSYLMTEDESNEATDCSTDNENDKLTTIPEDTEPISVNKTNSFSSSTSAACSYANSTPPPLVSPSREQLERLQVTMKKVNIPVTITTYPILSRFEGAQGVVAQMLATSSTPFSSELHQAIQDLNFINDWGQHKIDLIQGYSPTKRTSKSFFNYLLLDPKIIKRANFSGNHLKTGIITNAEKFETFLSAIFYIGKGCGRRPIQHLVEAKTKLLESKSKKMNAGEKLDKILEIWKSGLGVVVVSNFHHSSEREANVNEAAMIDAVGLVELSNLKKGSYTGSVATQWSQKTKNQFGSFLLYKCFCSFVVSDPRYFFPQDI